MLLGTQAGGMALTQSTVVPDPTHARQPICQPMHVFSARNVALAPPGKLLGDLCCVHSLACTSHLSG